jgi:hypothetical protein
MVSIIKIYACKAIISMWKRAHTKFIISPGINQRVCPKDIKNCPNIIPIRMNIISPANKFP